MTAIHASFTEPPFDRTVRRLAMALSAMAGGGSKHHHHHRSRHQHRGPGGHGPRGWGGRGRGGFPFDVFGGPGFGRPPGPGGPFGWRPKARRGDVRIGRAAAARRGAAQRLRIMQELEQRSGGAWRPSPGSVYPALQQLEDEGLIRSERAGRPQALRSDRRRSRLRRRAPRERARAVGDDGRRRRQRRRRRGRRRSCATCAGVRAGPARRQRGAGRRGRARARRHAPALYRILADGEPEPGAEQPE